MARSCEENQKKVVWKWQGFRKCQKRLIAKRCSKLKAKRKKKSIGFAVFGGH